jgi:hypothetical protein
MIYMALAGANHDIDLGNGLSLATETFQQRAASLTSSSRIKEDEVMMGARSSCHLSRPESPSTSFIAA